MKPKRVARALVRKLIPKRRKSDSKIESGAVFIIAGAKGLYGAGLMSALAATRAGAGYTHLMSDLIKFPWLKFPDFIVHDFSIRSLKKYQEAVVAIGPGLGLKSDKKKYLEYLIKKQFLKVVADGDALTFLSKMKISKLPQTWLLTPHEGELARLMKVSSLQIKQNRLFYIKEAQKKFGCIILLKGAETLIASEKDVISVNNGTVALAKAGTGDVLTGMISAFYAQTKNPIDAAILGSYLHGESAKLWAIKKDYLSMRPVDLIDKIPEAIFKVRRGGI